MPRERAVPGSPFKVALVQAAPVYMDRDATLDKACELILEAAENGARLVAFPESFVPGYPSWVGDVPSGERRVLAELYADLVANAVTIPSDPLDKLCRIARRARTYVVLGVSECNTEASGASLYNTLLFIDSQGQILGKQRQLLPTAGERLIWAQGDGSSLKVYDTPLGKLGGLTGWDNYLPLARFALYASGVQLYFAPAWERGEPWLASLQHLAKEGRMYVLSPGCILQQSDIPAPYVFETGSTKIGDGWLNLGDSAIVNPDGEFIAGPVRMKQEIVYGIIDLKALRGGKWILDVAGHSARPDIFQLLVTRSPRDLVNDDTQQPSFASTPISSEAQLGI